MSILHPRFWSEIGCDQEMMAVVHRHRIVSMKTVFPPAFIEEACRNGAMKCPTGYAVYTWDDCLISKWTKETVSRCDWASFRDNGGPLDTLAVWKAKGVKTNLIFGAERMTRTDMREVMRFPDAAACLGVPLQLAFVTSGDANVFLTAQAGPFRHSFAASITLDRMSLADTRLACKSQPSSHPWHAIRDSHLREEAIVNLHGEAGGITQRILGALKLSETNESLLFDCEQLRRSLNTFFPNA